MLSERRPGLRFVNAYNFLPPNFTLPSPRAALLHIQEPSTLSLPFPIPTCSTWISFPLPCDQNSLLSSSLHTQDLSKLPFPHSNYRHTSEPTPKTGAGTAPSSLLLPAGEGPLAMHRGAPQPITGSNLPVQIPAISAGSQLFPRQTQPRRNRRTSRGEGFSSTPPLSPPGPAPSAHLLEPRLRPPRQSPRATPPWWAG